MVLSKGRTRTRPALQFCRPLGSPLKYGRGQILTFPPLSTSSKSYDVTRVHGFHTTNRPIGCGEMAVEDGKKWIDATLEIAYPPSNPADGRPLGSFRKVAGRAGEGQEEYGRDNDTECPDRLENPPDPRPPRGRPVCRLQRAFADPGRTRRWQGRPGPPHSCHLATSGLLLHKGELCRGSH